MHIGKLASMVASAIAVVSLGVTSAFANTITVQQGQTFWSIARQRGIPVSSLVSANPSVNPMNMLVGTRITVPGQSVSNSANAALPTSQNMYWLEHVINAEAGGESLRAQIAVGDVILHRMESGQYGSTVRDVVFQVSAGHYQFSSVPNGYIYTAPSANSIAAAKDVLYGGQDVVPGAMVFFNPAQTPSGSWVWSQPEITQIDNLVFSK